MTPLYETKALEYGIKMHSPCAGDAEMLLHTNGKFTMGKLKSSLLS
jgi:hypothetical protein